MQPAKRYVTHMLEENKAKVWELLEAGGYVYVCGYVCVLVNHSFLTHRSIQSLYQQA